MRKALETIVGVTRGAVRLGDDLGGKYNSIKPGGKYTQSAFE